MYPLHSLTFRTVSLFVVELTVYSQSVVLIDETMNSEQFAVAHKTRSIFVKYSLG